MGLFSRSNKQNKLNEELIASLTRQLHARDKEVEEQKSIINHLRSNLQDANNELKQLKQHVSELEKELSQQKVKTQSQVSKATVSKPSTPVTTIVNNEPSKIPVFKKPIKKIGNIKLSDEQSDTVDKLETTMRNYFVTGKAGTGKSVVLRYFIANTKKTVAVLAPTGIAAINVGGQTIHSFFGLEPTVQNTFDSDAIYKGLSQNRIQVLRSVDTIVIDEISMVRADIMDMIDAKLQAARRNKNPFGGCQMILFGDLFQLPPVLGKDKTSSNYLQDTYHTLFFFGAPACKAKPFIVIELKDVFRQKDAKFVSVLNQIRTGNVNASSLSVINQRVNQSITDHNVITLVPTNDVANEINHAKMEQLAPPTFEYHGEITGTFSEKECPADLCLKLRLGAQVMMLKNDSKRRWVNGTLAIVSKLTNDLIEVTINEHSYSVDKTSWEKYQYEYDPEEHKLVKTAAGSFKQYPIRLAYAITIHKSQGQTYEAVTIDYSKKRAFDAGQTYVALSRCRSLEHTYLTDAIRIEDIQVNQEIVDYMKRVST